METKELFHPASASDDYYICCFSVMSAELFFRRGETKLKQDYSTVFDVEQVIKYAIDCYVDEGEVNYFCSMALLMLISI